VLTGRLTELASLGISRIVSPEHASNSRTPSIAHVAKDVPDGANLHERTRLRCVMAQTCSPVAMSKIRAVSSREAVAS
jgi:hypothetical protein